MFDWGGGTLDITLTKVDNGTIREISNAGFPGKSGDHFDEMLMNRLINQFLDDENISAEDFHLNSGVAGIFQHDVESAKIQLSSDKEAGIELFDFFLLREESYDLFRSVTRTEFEQIICDDIELAIKNIQKVLDEAKIDLSQVAKVLLVGGTSKIPLLCESVFKLFGVSKIIPIKNSGTLISEGAAVIAYHDWQPFLVKPLCLQLSDDTHIEVFEEGTVLNPKFAEENKTFFCTDNRNAEAYFIISENTGINEYKVKKILTVPVSQNLNDAFTEKLYVNFNFDDDLIFWLNARGSIRGESRRTQVHDICYGLRFA